MKMTSGKTTEITSGEPKTADRSNQSKKYLVVLKRALPLYWGDCNHGHQGDMKFTN